MTKSLRAPIQALEGHMLKKSPNVRLTAYLSATKVTFDSIISTTVNYQQFVKKKTSTKEELKAKYHMPSAFPYAKQCTADRAAQDRKSGHLTAHGHRHNV